MREDRINGGPCARVFVSLEGEKKSLVSGHWSTGKRKKSRHGAELFPDDCWPMTDDPIDRIDGDGR